MPIPGLGHFRVGAHPGGFRARRRAAAAGARPRRAVRARHRSARPALLPDAARAGHAGQRPVPLDRMEPAHRVRAARSSDLRDRPWRSVRRAAAARGDRRLSGRDERHQMRPRPDRGDRRHCADLRLRARAGARTRQQGDLEDPAYPFVRTRMPKLGFEPVGAPVDEQGMDFEKALAIAPDAAIAFVSPSHNVPSGACFTLERRKALVEWADKNGRWIVENEFDGDFPLHLAASADLLFAFARSARADDRQPLQAFRAGPAVGLSALAA